MSVSSQLIYPSHEYEVRVTRHHDRPDGTDVVPAGDLDPEVVDVLREAVPEGSAGFDDLPRGAFDLAAGRAVDCDPGHDWCPADAHYLTVEVDEQEPNADSALDIDATATDGDLRLSVSPRDERAVVTSGPPAPFGVPHAVGIDGTDHAFVPASEYDSGVAVTDHGLVTNLSKEWTTIDTGERIARTYEMTSWEGGTPVPGRYVLADDAESDSLTLAHTTPSLADGDRLASRTDRVLDVRVEFDVVEA